MLDQERCAANAISEVGARTILPYERAEALFYWARYAATLTGGWVEAGAYRGGSARLIQIAMGSAKRGWVFDTFRGTPERHDGIDVHSAGDFGDTTLEQVTRLLTHPDSNVTLVEGVFPESAGPWEQEAVGLSLVHLDLDQYRATRDGLLWAWPRLEPTGVIVLDDWNWQNCPGVRRACEEVLNEDALIVSGVQHQLVVIKSIRSPN